MSNSRMAKTPTQPGHGPQNPGEQATESADLRKTNSIPSTLGVSQRGQTSMTFPMPRQRAFLQHGEAPPGTLPE